VSLHKRFFIVENGPLSLQTSSGIVSLATGSLFRASESKKLQALIENGFVREAMASEVITEYVDYAKKLFHCTFRR
jgi:hypothetical protein